MSELSPTPPTREERLARRDRIAALEQSMAQMDPALRLCVESMTHHHFASGVYCREARIPKGATVVGKIHRTQHLAILLSGSVWIATEGQADAQLFHAPQIMVSPAGVKRVAHAVTDATWLAIHAVGEERDLSNIEQMFIAPDFETLEAQHAAHELESA